VISSSQRLIPDNTQQSQQTNIHASGGIRTYDLSRRAAADRAATGTGERGVSTAIKLRKKYGNVPKDIRAEVTKVITINGNKSFSE
jgi:hypothetical protein